jgi:hypothetical protein
LRGNRTAKDPGNGLRAAKDAFFGIGTPIGLEKTAGACNLNRGNGISSPNTVNPAKP